MLKAAVFNSERTERYSLMRAWDSNLPRAVFILYNPSLGCEVKDDPTISRLYSLSKSYGFGSFEIVSLFPVVTQNPNDLDTNLMVDREANLVYIEKALDKADIAIASWGERVHKHHNLADVFESLFKYQLHCLGLTSSQTPVHPLYHFQEKSLEILNTVEVLSKAA